MWARIINMLLGIWLMASPAVLGYGEPARSHDRIVGPVLAACACVAIWEVTRSLRWVNLPAGLWLLAAPWVLSYGAADATANSMIVGGIVALLALHHGKTTHRFGGGWSVLWRRTAGTS